MVDATKPKEREFGSFCAGRSKFLFESFRLLWNAEIVHPAFFVKFDYNKRKRKGLIKSGMSGFSRGNRRGRRIIFRSRVAAGKQM